VIIFHIRAISVHCQHNTHLRRLSLLL